MYTKDNIWFKYQFNFITKKYNFLVISFLCAFLLLSSKSLYAQGVIAGTNIINLATVSYSVNNVKQEPINSSPNGNTIAGNSNGTATQFVVDRKVDLVVTGNANANVNPGDAQAELTYTLQNEGNAIQEFSLATDSLISTDGFDPNSCAITVTGVTGTPVTGVILPTSGNIKLNADQQASISVKCDIPLDDSGSAILLGETGLVSLKATAVKNDDDSNTVESNASEAANTIETVFADGSGSDDNTRDASHSDRRAFIASTGTLPPTLKMEKSIVSVVDPNGGSSAISGSEVTYKIQINTAGIGTIENLVITDPTPIEMTYKNNSILLNNINQSDASDAADNTDFGINNSDTATINLGNFAAGSQYEIQLTYIIN